MSAAAPPDAREDDSFAGSGETFLPLRDDEPTDASTASRLLDYCGLIDDITAKLVADSSWDTKGLNASGFGRYMRVHGRFAPYLHINFTAWRDHGKTPLWCRCYFRDDADREREVQKSLDDKYVDNAGYPILLKTGVERSKVTDDATEQMREIADRLRKLNPAQRERLS